jgi:hypothetical protein
MLSDITELSKELLSEQKELVSATHGQRQVMILYQKKFTQLTIKNL